MARPKMPPIYIRAAVGSRPERVLARFWTKTANVLAATSCIAIRPGVCGEDWSETSTLLCLSTRLEKQFRPFLSVFYAQASTRS
jgi:hypothetical protein